MTEVIFAIGLIVWLLAAYAMVRLLISWAAIARAAPAGQGLKAAFELGGLNYPAVRRRVGAAADAHIKVFSRSVGMFVVCTGALIVLVIITAIAGKAA